MRQPWRLMGSRSQLQAKGKNRKVPGLTDQILIGECVFS
jgi:hypothetical protein